MWSSPLCGRWCCNQRLLLPLRELSEGDGGRPFVAWATLDLRLFSFGDTKPARYKSSPKVSRTFCGSCGTSLTYQHEDRADEVDVTIPTLDDPEQLEPECHIWVSDKLPWLRLEDGLPQYPEWKRSS